MNRPVQTARKLLERDGRWEGETGADFDALFAVVRHSRRRRRLTAVTLEAAGAHSSPSLCVLGAGNCHDLDLEALAQRYTEIHLVDIDANAVAGAFARQSAATQARLTLHAPIDLSGLLDRVDRWFHLQVTPAELMAHPSETARKIRAELAGQYEVVLPSCLLSQMQLSLLNVLADRHPLFSAAFLTLNLTHLRTLAELARPAGCALLATDASSSRLHPLGDVPNGTDCRPLLVELLELGRVFDFADPTQLAAQMGEDPLLRAAFAVPEVRDAWLWTNGPDTKFLVYAAALPRR